MNCLRKWSITMHRVIPLICCTKSFEQRYQRQRWLKTNLIPLYYRRKNIKIITTEYSKIEGSVRTTSPPSSLISCPPSPRPPPLWGLVLAAETELQRLGSRLGEAEGKSQGGTERRSCSADWWALASLQFHQSRPIVRNLCSLRQTHLSCTFDSRAFTYTVAPPCLSAS